MKYVLRIITATAAVLAFGAGSAQAWNVHGRVVCGANSIGVIGATLTISAPGQPSQTTTTDSDGFYTFDLDSLFSPPATPRGYSLVLNLSSLPSDAVVTSPGGNIFNFATTDNISEFEQNFVISTATCTPSGCWMTGGGQRIDPYLKIPVAEKGTKDNFGGNVNPGCSATAGDGGNWNHIDRGSKRHFQGQHIEVVRCGNVSGIPPGSTSPVTPFNFIEFKGTGRVQGVQGNKENWDNVFFFGRVEDRNEPGSGGGVDDGALIDRYFLQVYTNQADPAGSTIILEDIDGSASTVDPAQITHGNLQLHVSSCAN